MVAESILLKLIGLNEDDIGIQFLMNTFVKHRKEILYIIENLDVFITLMKTLKEQESKK